MNKTEGVRKKDEARDKQATINAAIKQILDPASTGSEIKKIIIKLADEIPGAMRMKICPKDTIMIPSKVQDDIVVGRNMTNEETLIYFPKNRMLYII